MSVAPNERLPDQGALAGRVAAHIRSPTRFQARLIATRDLTRDIQEFLFQAKEPPLFEPGQYALLDLPGVAGLRAYSMSNLANAEGEWHFQIKRVPNGAGSNALFDGVAIGASVTIDGPYGMAFLRRDSALDLVCIAGGSGLSPMIAIARGLAAEPRLANRTLHFFYGGRGPAVFARKSQQSIEADAWWLTIVSTLLVFAVLTIAYRSPRLTMLAFLPVASGVVAAIGSVGLVFGSCHIITIGFGATLIGKAVDYPTYLFMQRRANETMRVTARRIGPSLRLAVLTTVFGSAAMLASSFSGVAQLGLFTLAGVGVAGLVTRFVIPALSVDARLGGGDCRSAPHRMGQWGD
ncbi:MAG: hypothetical protein EXR39_05925 [Betaproteobacteria bacterium]|nr:hypothetical protein [Betaproteobacteria bacterium]